MKCAWEVFPRTSLLKTQSQKEDWVKLWKKKISPVTIENIVNVPELKDGSGLIRGVGWTVAPSQDLGMA